MSATLPRIAIIDSGLGGLTVFAEIRNALPAAEHLYFADDAAFPYGALPDAELIERVTGLVGAIITQHAPDIIVLACNTASTLCLPTLRQRFSTPFVGTVPAIKPAALASQSRCISVLATPGTIARDYTRSLIATHAADCHVTTVAAPHLAAFAEAELQGEPVTDTQIAESIAPAFVEYHGRRTDGVVLACTHYPLLQSRFIALAPWHVEWIDPAAAIARRVASLLPASLQGMAPEAALAPEAFFTSGKAASPMLQRSLQNFAIVAINPFPLPEHISIKG